MGFEHGEVGFGEKYGLGNGIVPPPPLSGPSLNYPMFFLLIPNSSKFKYFQLWYGTSGFKPFSYLISVIHFALFHLLCIL